MIEEKLGGERAATLVGVRVRVAGRARQTGAAGSLITRRSPGFPQINAD
jgi:hypothetical protein